MKQAFKLSALGLLLFTTQFVQAQTRPAAGRLEQSQAGRTSTLASKDRRLTAPIKVSVLQSRIKQCSDDRMCLRILAEYGGMLVADTDRITLPPRVYFRNEEDVQQFQQRVGKLAEVVDGVRVELQAEALKAYLRARNEAKQRGLEISPRGTLAARRSYADTVKLWRGRVEAGLGHWVQRGELTKADAAKVRSLSLATQVSAVLALEDNHLFTGNHLETLHFHRWSCLTIYAGKH